VAPDISIVVPTLNEAACIQRTIRALRIAAPSAEIIVVDGGSSDATVDLAHSAGARVLNADRGRGIQLHAGAALSSAPVLWFVHADTLVPRDAVQRIAVCLARTDVAGGNFELNFDGDSRGARQLTAIYPKLRRLGLCYGDSGIFVRREVYERIGGFQPYPIFEDLDLVRRIRREGKFVHLDARLTTSSRRFEGRSFPAMFAHWTALQILFWFGVSPWRLNRWYAPMRASKEA
jgi:rSAM/selenodomain-associated transferase 2